jgi:hypothetical protein
VVNIGFAASHKSAARELSFGAYGTHPSAFQNPAVPHELRSSGFFANVAGSENIVSYASDFVHG